MPDLAIQKPEIAPTLFLEVLADLRDYHEAMDFFLGDIEEKEEYLAFWKGRLPWFREQLELGMTLCESNARASSRIDLERLYDFLEEYRETGKNVASAKKAGLTWQTIRRRLTRGDTFFLPSFYAAYEEVRDELKTGLKDLVYEQAVDSEANKASMPAVKMSLVHLGDDAEERPNRPDARPVDAVIRHIVEKAQPTGKVIQVN